MPMGRRRIVGNDPAAEISGPESAGARNREERQMASRYHEVYEGWKRDPDGFWAEAAGEIDWIKPWDKVFDETLGDYGQWFAGAECNTCYNCLDRHVERGRPASRRSSTTARSPAPRPSIPTRRRWNG